MNTTSRWVGGKRFIIFLTSESTCSLTKWFSTLRSSRSFPPRLERSLSSVGSTIFSIFCSRYQSMITLWAILTIHALNLPELVYLPCCSFTMTFI